MGDEPNRPDVHDGTCRVGALDVLQITARGCRDLDQEQIVRLDGNTTFPMPGQVAEMIGLHEQLQ